MRSKSPLTLIELVIMIAVFALAAALCLQAFVWADLKSDANQQRDRALLAAQTAAEQIKEAGFAESSSLEKEGFTLTVTPENTGNPLLGKAVVKAVNEEDEVLAELVVCWQEGVQ